MVQSATGDNNENLSQELSTLHRIQSDINTSFNAGEIQKADMIKDCNAGIGNIWKSCMSAGVCPPGAGIGGENMNAYLSSSSSIGEKYNLIANFYNWVPSSPTNTDQPPTACSEAGAGWAEAKQWIQNQKVAVTDVDIIQNPNVDESCPCWSCLTPNQKEQIINANKSDWQPIIDKCISNANKKSMPFLQSDTSIMQSIDNIRNDLLEQKPNEFEQKYNNAIISADNLENKLITSTVLQEESKNVKNNLDNIDSLSINNLRMAEINTYYSEKYRLQLNIIKLCIFFGIIMLILIILNKKLAFPNFLYSGLMSVAIIASIYYVIPAFYDYYKRDNINMQQYNWGKYNPNIDDDTTRAVYVKEPSLLTVNSNSLNSVWNKIKQSETDDCKGIECCESDQVFSNNKCITTPNSAIKT